jgi:hypothetical protein
MRRRLPILLTGLLLAVPASAQEPEVRTVPFDGPEFFAHILFNEGLKPVHSLDDAVHDGPNTLLIVFGDPFFFTGGKGNTSRWDRFQQAGCNILIATDHDLAIPALTLHINGVKIVQPDEARAFNGSRSCPWVPIPPSDPAEGELANDHPIFHFLRQALATNCPSHVTVSPADVPVKPLLNFPPDVRGGGVGTPMGLMPGRKLGGPRPPRHYVVGSPRNAPPEGRILVIAGHGLFTNGMMLQPDTGNFDFATNVVRWLREAPNGEKRQRALFMVDRKIIDDFDMKLTPRPPSIPVPTVEMLNRLIRGWEDEQFLQRAVSGLLGHRAGRFIAIVVGIVSILVLFYGMKKLTEARHHLDTAAPSLVGVAPAPHPVAPIAERSQAKLRKGEYAEEARQLAVEWLRVELGVAPEALPADARDMFAAKGFFWQRWRLLRQAKFVFMQARSVATAPVPRREFFALVESLRALSAALKDGRLVLLHSQKDVRQA